MASPADGEKLVARGQVVRSGRTNIIAKAEVFAVKRGKDTLCAMTRQTIIVMHGKVEKQGEVDTLRAVRRLVAAAGSATEIASAGDSGSRPEAGHWR